MSGGLGRLATTGRRPRIAVTMGDPAGIGPEIAVKACRDPRVLAVCEPVLIGIPSVFVRAARFCSDRGPFPEVLASQGGEGEAFAPGAATAAAGGAAYEAIVAAVAEVRSGRVAAVVTAPICKESIRAAGVPFPGHTEIIAALTGAASSCMLLIHESLRVSHVTTHVPLREACDLVTCERVLAVLRLTWKFLIGYGIDSPRIGVAGLNPHAGESGIFGREEAESIRPAILEAESEGIAAFGPFPADSLFPAARDGAYQAVVAMYHDQGHIPVKMAGFKKDTNGSAEIRGVNVSLGLPIIRTSVDHGTAFDIAWRGEASAASMIDAILVAARMAGSRIPEWV